MVVVEARLGVWVVGLVYPYQAVGTASEDGSAGSANGSDRLAGPLTSPPLLLVTHAPSGEKLRRVMPERWHGTDETFSAGA